MYIYKEDLYIPTYSVSWNVREIKQEHEIHVLVYLFFYFLEGGRFLPTVYDQALHCNHLRVVVTLAVGSHSCVRCLGWECFLPSFLTYLLT